jgi:hypothetical protein
MTTSPVLYEERMTTGRAPAGGMGVSVGTAVAVAVAVLVRVAVGVAVGVGVSVSAAWKFGLAFVVAAGRKDSINTTRRSKLSKRRCFFMDIDSIVT